MAKIGCLKPFRGTLANMSNVVLEDGEIAFTKGDGTNRIYFGNGIDTVDNLEPFAMIGNMNNISTIGSGTITNAIQTINNNKGRLISPEKLNIYHPNNDGIYFIVGVSYSNHGSKPNGYWDRVLRFASNGYAISWFVTIDIASNYMSGNEGGCKILASYYYDRFSYSTKLGNSTSTVSKMRVVDDGSYRYIEILSSNYNPHTYAIQITGCVCQGVDIYSNVEYIPETPTVGRIVDTATFS